jgi:hypothetical protein
VRSGCPVDPGTGAQIAVQKSPFHSEGGIGSEVKGVLTAKWLAAPINDLGLQARIRREASPNRVATICPPAAVDFNNGDLRRNFRNVTFFTPNNTSDFQFESNHDFECHSAVDRAPVMALQP